MDLIKKAFQNIKEDIDLLRKETKFLRENLNETREKLIEICEIIKKISQKIEYKDSTYKEENKPFSTHNPTYNSSFKPLKPQNTPFSIRNEGVPTDRQTDRQTDRHTEKKSKLPEIPLKLIEEEVLEEIKLKKVDPIGDAVEILDSLDNLKKEIRIKFKKLTEQELAVFSTLYQLDEDEGHTNYQTLSKKLNLTESSIRDYIGRLIKKGIPVEKKRVNNKNIQLSISKNLKKIASLSTILKLRDI